jgi:hypothetical protein
LGKAVHTIGYIMAIEVDKKLWLFFLCIFLYKYNVCSGFDPEPMFIAALFTIVKLWKQPRCPTTDKWIKKIWYLYTMEFYPATKKNEILSFTSKCMELENIILSEVSQA